MLRSGSFGRMKSRVVREHSWFSLTMGWGSGKAGLVMSDSKLGSLGVGYFSGALEQCSTETGNFSPA